MISSAQKEERGFIRNHKEKVINRKNTIFLLFQVRDNERDHKRRMGEIIRKTSCGLDEHDILGENLNIPYYEDEFEPGEEVSQVPGVSEEASTEKAGKMTEVLMVMRMMLATWNNIMIKYDSVDLLSLL